VEQTKENTMLRNFTAALIATALVAGPALAAIEIAERHGTLLGFGGHCGERMKERASHVGLTG